MTYIIMLKLTYQCKNFKKKIDNFILCFTIFMYNMNHNKLQNIVPIIPFPNNKGIGKFFIHISIEKNIN